MEVEVADGATVGDDMEWVEEGMTMAGYVESALAGSTLYLKYEDFDDFKAKLPEELGRRLVQFLAMSPFRLALRVFSFYIVFFSIIDNLGGALEEAEELRKVGQWKDRFDEQEFSDYNWSILLGGAHTTTAIVSILY